MNPVYLETARLLTQVAPLIVVDDTFALKGGTAIALIGLGSKYDEQTLRRVVSERNGKNLFNGWVDVDMKQLRVCLSLMLVFLGSLAAASAETQAPAGPEGLATALRPHVTPLRAAEDLDAIDAVFGDRRAVLLGEASHGTEEFYVVRAEISKRLIADEGFRFIAVEGDWGSSAAVNRYVKHVEGAPESPLAALQGFRRWPTWLWFNRPTLELIEWLREHNAELPMELRVGFYGIDLYGMDESMDKAHRHMRELDEGMAQEAWQAYACLRRFESDMQQYVADVARGRSCASDVENVVVRLREGRDQWRQHSPEAYFHAKQNALVVKHAERHYRAMLQQDHTSWNARARHFHITLERLLEHYGNDARGIVWAHNTHIGDARATAMAQHRMVNIGQLARETLGAEEVALVGFGTHRGKVVAGKAWGAAREVMDVPPAASGSLEDLLLQVMEEPFLLLMDDVRELEGLERPIGHRAIGVTYNPLQERGNYVPTILRDRYDAFIFLPVTTALRMIEDDADQPAW
jgi:erythromycin esterase